MQNKKYITITILSMAFTTIMAGAAVSPALGMIAKHFYNTDLFLIRQVISLQSIFIIISAFIFNIFTKIFSVKIIGIIGIVLYIVGGCGAGFCDNIYLILILRAILGIGVGLLQPLSTGLVGFLYEKNEQSKLLGYMSAISSFAAVVTTPLASILGSISWNYSFFIYSFGLIIIIPIVIFLPNIKISKKTKSHKKRALKRVFPYIFGVFLVMLTFYSFPTNFSLVMVEENFIDKKYIGMLMGFQNLFAFLAGVLFVKLINLFKSKTEIIFAFLYSFGFYAQYCAVNIYLVIVGLILVGFANGFLIPYMFSKASINSKKYDIAFSMSCMSIGLYLGQFVNPYVIETFADIFNIKDVKVGFELSFIISIFLIFYMLFIKYNDFIKNRLH